MFIDMIYNIFDIYGIGDSDFYFLSVNPSLLLMLHSYLFTREIELDNWTIQVEKTIIY